MFYHPRYHFKSFNKTMDIRIREALNEDNSAMSILSFCGYLPRICSFKNSPSYLSNKFPVKGNKVVTIDRKNFFDLMMEKLLAFLPNLSFSYVFRFFRVVIALHLRASYLPHIIKLTFVKKSNRESSRF